jgi:hypothetical protein
MTLARISNEYERSQLNSEIQLKSKPGWWMNAGSGREHTENTGHKVTSISHQKHFCSFLSNSFPTKVG